MGCRTCISRTKLNHPLCIETRADVPSHRCPEFDLKRSDRLQAHIPCAWSGGASTSRLDGSSLGHPPTIHSLKDTNLDKSSAPTNCTAHVIPSDRDLTHISPSQGRHVILRQSVGRPYGARRDRSSAVDLARLGTRWEAVRGPRNTTVFEGFFDCVMVVPSIPYCRAIGLRSSSLRLQPWPG